MTYTFPDAERFATTALLHFAAAEKAPNLMARMAHEAQAQRAIYHAYAAWRGGWR